MISGIVKDVFPSDREDFVSVSKDDMLSRCFTLFKKETPPVLAVLNEVGDYEGVLARRWVIRSKVDPSKTKVEKLMRTAPKVTLRDRIRRAARLMIESGIRQLPVYSGKKFLGFVTDESIINWAVKQKWGNTAVKEVMTKKPFVVEKDDSIGSVLSLFREQGISHAPVEDAGKLEGILGIHDIIEYAFKPKERVGVDARREKIRVLNAEVKELMVKRVISVLPESKLRDAADKMREFDISSLVVVRKARPVGMLTKRDFLESIAQLDMPQHRLTVQFSAKDVGVDESQRRFMMNEFESFAGRNREGLEAGTLFIYLKAHGTNYKGDQLLHCRLQLRTRKGGFFSSSEGWGVEQIFGIALDRLEKQILRSGELERDPEIANRYLRLIDFPFTEL